jgi:hypothetical protein
MIGSTTGCHTLNSVLSAPLDCSQRDGGFFGVHLISHFIIGARACTNTQQFLSPWPVHGLDQYKNRFNYWLSHSQQCVERSFGLLTKRWGIFWCPFNFTFHHWSTVILICMNLHNLCLDRNLNIPLNHFSEDVRDGNEWVVYDNDQDDDAQL